MKLSKSLTMLLGTAAMFAMYGCGSDNRESNIDQQTATFQASAACISCHATNKTSPVTGALIVEEWKKSVHNTNAGAACTDCHTNSGHPNGGSIVAAVEDTQCATCHTVASLGYPHFANYTTSLAAQYVSQTDAAGVQCRQCHNPHDTTSLIQYNKDWTESGHGNVGYVPGNASASSVNSHYPWTTAGRDSCAKCHTSTGYLKHVVGGTTTLTTNAGVSTITAGPYMSNNKKNEAIMCSACHEDYSWKRRSIGARTMEYTYDADLVPGGGSDAFAGAAPATANGAAPETAVVLPDVGDSNLCLVCHGGRGNFQSKRASRFEGHHAATGADLFAANSHFGFEFAGRDYTKPAAYAHDSIGVATGAGPCVSCHMKSTKSHTFDAVTKNASGVITAINTQAVCNTCHTGASAINAATLEEQSLGYQNAGKLVIDYLANTVPNYTGAPIVITTTAQANAAHVNTYGAFQNSLLTSEDPGGYAHNIY
ncbi:partial C-type polyheme cytochrome OmcB, partial [Geobacteraceae bacterium]